MNRTELATLILQKLSSQERQLKAAYETSNRQIGYFVVDNLLPSDAAQSIFQAFPRSESMKLRKSMREYKYVAAQMNNYAPILEEAVYAFQDPRVVDAIKTITAIDSLYPDEFLYAGGISLMGNGQFLNPHLDNSHEKERKRWRVLNLLYYVSPGWKGEYGGNLEIWPEGLQKPQLTIQSNFNRLVVMATHGESWHSVSPITDDVSRACVSNYYFSDSPLRSEDEFHVTSFRGRPEQRFRDLLLRGDIALRQGVRKLFPGGAIKSDHWYKRRHRDADE